MATMGKHQGKGCSVSLSFSTDSEVLVTGGVKQTLLQLPFRAISQGHTYFIFSRATPRSARPSSAQPTIHHFKTSRGLVALARFVMWYPYAYCATSVELQLVTLGVL